MLYKDDTLYEGDILMILEELEEQTRLCISRSRDDNFPQNFVHERPTTSFSPALHVADNYASGLYTK